VILQAARIDQRGKKPALKIGNLTVEKDFDEHLANSAALSGGLPGQIRAGNHRWKGGYPLRFPSSEPSAQRGG